MTAREAADLDALVARIEARTGTQIVPAIVGKSDSYVELPWTAFARGASLAAFGLVLPCSGWKPEEFPSNARIAAGLLLLYPGADGRSIPLTVRSSRLRPHAGQVSLPGGATDAGETLTQAALPEAYEEVGTDPSRVRILGELTPVHVLVSGFTLHPIVGITDDSPSFYARRE